MRLKKMRVKKRMVEATTKRTMGWMIKAKRTPQRKPAISTK